MEDNKRFIWNCTKFLASILCVLSSAIWWMIRFVILGYVTLICGLLFAVLIYLTEISPALKQEKIDNKD